MHEFSADYLRCVRCGGRLELEVLAGGAEVDEGFLRCGACSLDFPIVSAVPIMWDDFGLYLRQRARLGGELYLKCGHPRMRDHIRKTLSQMGTGAADMSRQEERWVGVYRSSSRSRFYTAVRKELDMVSYGSFLEHGCSVGTVSRHAARHADLGFGIDRSFYAVLEAKRVRRRNLDYFVADSLEHPFGTRRFALVMALNMLDIVEPASLLDIVSEQAESLLLISDPYDFERAGGAVRRAVDEARIRDMIRGAGFAPLSGTSRPGRIPWSLALNPRARLNYRVDLIIARRVQGAAPCGTD